MGIFKKKVVKDIHDGLWGHMVAVHGMNVDTLSREMKCVEREGATDGGEPVTLVRVFRPGETEEKGITVAGWETFDEHPELVLFEGYLTRANRAYLERKREKV